MRGGKRNGAGRKPGSLNNKPKGIRITPTSSQETKVWLERQSDSYGKAIDRAVKLAVLGDV